MPPAEHTARELVRRFTLGSGALKRGSDRLQVLLRVLLAAALLAAVPIALTIGSLVYAHAQEEAAGQAANRHRVVAVLLEDAWTPPESNTSVLDAAQARVAWTYVPGTDVQERLVHVPRGTITGARVTIWVDPDGRLTTRPLTADQVSGQGVAAGAGALLALTTTAVLAHLTARCAIDRSRLRRWAADWAAIEPTWRRELL